MVTVARQYDLLVQNLLEEEQGETPEVITLTPEADKMLEAFSYEIESKLKTEYEDIADWAGKLVGAVTHVMVANPTEGYGIFIENMLNAAQNQVIPKAA